MLGVIRASTDRNVGGNKWGLEEGGLGVDIADQILTDFNQQLMTVNHKHSPSILVQS